MKRIKIVLTLLVIFGGLLSLSNCRADDSQKGLEKLNKLKSTDKVSETLLELGVQRINVREGMITFETFGDFLYREKVVNFSNYTITSENNTLSTKNVSLFIDNNGDIVISNSYVTNKKLKDIDYSKELHEDDLILVLAYLELSGDVVSKATNLGQKTSYVQKQKEMIAHGGGACSFFNVRRACGFGFTQAEADADLWVATVNFANSHMGEGCTSIGGVSHKDMGFAVISIQSFCCA